MAKARFPIAFAFADRISRDRTLAKLRHLGSAALEFGLELAFADRIVLVRLLNQDLKWNSRRLRKRKYEIYFAPRPRHPSHDGRTRAPSSDRSPHRPDAANARRDDRAGPACGAGRLRDFDFFGTSLFHRRTDRRRQSDAAHPESCSSHQTDKDWPARLRPAYLGSDLARDRRRLGGPHEPRACGGRVRAGRVSA